jgi:hypothetical protein
MTGTLEKLSDDIYTWLATFQNKSHLMVSKQENFHCSQCGNDLKEGKFWFVNNSTDPFMFCSEKCYNLFKLKE